METAIQTVRAAPPSGLAALPLKSKFGLLIGAAALASVLVASLIWSRTPDYRVLFANLGDKDGGAVIASLSQMNIPYRFAESGGAILVPADQVHDARLRLASQGLPKGGAVGFELMESQKFGVTQFQERLNFQRGLEGELARSIMSLAAVQNARVHLALPTQNGFMREQQKPSASVLLTLHPARTLDRAQVAGIVHLVAASIPDMTPRQVSVIDQNGGLLSAQGDGNGGGMDPAQLGYVRQIESSYMQRIIDIVEPIVGRGNVRAQVTADVDFTQSESTAEEYKPNQGRDAAAAVRSTQNSEGSSREGGGTTAQGVPGALSNQPPAPASAPINGAAQPLQAATGAAAAAGAVAAGNSRRDSVTNYEVDKTVKVTRNATGAIKRVTAAVLLNHRRNVDRAGKVTAVALPEKELENINNLVREAIGFSKDRGDSINVVNAPFTQEEVPKAVEVPMWKNPELIAMAKEIGKHVGLVLIGLVTIFGVIRPAIKAIPATPAGGRVNETIRDDVSLPSPGRSPMIPQSNDDAIRIAREDPATVANVVRTWVNKDG